jgi:DNA-binding MarR family transcriptional regulator
VIVYMHLMVEFGEAARTIAAQCTCRRVRQASRALTRLYDEALRPTGLQISQLTTLVGVAMRGDAGAGIGTLAEVLGMDRTTLTRNLGPLEKAGLLRVARAPQDARARIVFLTRSGERAIEASFPLWEKAQSRVRGLLGPSRLEDLQRRLVQAVSAISGPDRA